MAAMTEADAEAADLAGEDFVQWELAQQARWPLRDKIEALLADPNAVLTPEQEAVRDILRDRAYDAETAKIQAEWKAAEKAPLLDRAKPQAKAAGKTSLSVVVDKWAAEMTPSERTVRRTRNIVERFEAVNGRLPVEDVTPLHVLAFKDSLVAEKQTPANINVMIPMLGTIFIHAVSKLRIIATNPAAKIRVADKRRAKDKRRAFTEAELQRIFDSPVYSEGLRPKAGGGDAAYWLPLLALFTGGRQTELGQLYSDDVIQESYVDADGNGMSAWVIRIVENESRGQRVKNEGSERRVPVHSALIERGFLDVARQAAKRGPARIFDKIVPNSQNELMGNWSKWFGRYRRSKCGLLGKDTPFHSFRHCFKHYARLSGIQSETHNELTGHETGDVADDYGGLSYPLAPLVEGINRYRVPVTLPGRP